MVAPTPAAVRPVPTQKPPLDHLRPRYVLKRPADEVPAGSVPPTAEPAATIAVPKPIVPIPSAAKPAMPKPAAGLSPQPRTQPVPEIRPAAEPHRWRRTLLLAGLGVVVLAAGTLLQAAVLGELLIGIYGVVALVRRIESRTTFMLALVSLGCILVMLLVRPDLALMKNFAIYTFLFMLVGTLSLTTETRH